jgi:pimeloyl-ACP methyl ester carboxylesterase
MATYVLLHGGGMGGWIWKYMAPPLRKAGHEVFTPTYTGFGERIHLLSKDVDGSTHVADVVNVLKYEDLSDVIMVGHSYSGTVLPGVALQAGERIRRYVYLDAIVARAGETVVEALGFMPKEQAAHVYGLLKAGEIPPGSGVDAQQREMAKTDPLWMSDDRANWLLDHLSDMPLACTVTPLQHGADQLKGQVDYIAASHTIMTPMHQRARELGWAVHPYEGDHSLIVGQPEKMVDFLQTLA